jgi:hypothetical protein
MGAPASSYPTASIALRILWPRKPRHHVKVGIPSAGFWFIVTQNSVYSRRTVSLKLWSADHRRATAARRRFRKKKHCKNCITLKELKHTHMYLC